MSELSPEPTFEPVFVLLRELKQGDRFLTRGGQTLTVVEVRPAERAEYDYMEVVTEEPYIVGEYYIGRADSRVQLATIDGEPWQEPQWP